MAIFGQIGDGSSTGTSSADANLVNRSSEGTSSPGTNGILTSIRARLWLDSAGSSLAQAALWNSVGRLLATSDEITITNISEQELIFAFSGANAILLYAGTSYAYGVMWKDPGLQNMTWSRQNTSSTSLKNNVAYVTGTPQNPLGAGTVSGPVDMYVVYDDSNPVQHKKLNNSGLRPHPFSPGLTR